MKEKIFNNFSLKILSILCAIVLWAVIVNIYDPTTSVTISNVNVELINTESLTDKDYTYEVIDGSKISVYLSGPKSIITDIKSSDIVATADLSQITAFADYVDIDVKVIKDGREITNIEVTPRTTAVRLSIENRLTKEFTVTPELTGSVAEGHVLSNLNVSPNIIKITGASSLVESINSVKALCDVSGANSDISGRAKLVAYDSDGNVISGENLTFSRNEVDFTASVSASKVVPVKSGGTSGTVRDGYMIMGVELSFDSVELTGDIDVLNGISEIVIPASAVNVDGLSASRSYTVWISDYVDSGVNVKSENTLVINVKIADINSREISFDTSRIRFDNLKSGCRVVIEDGQTIPVVVSGDAELLAGITEEDITAVSNLAALSEGQHTVFVNFTVPDGCSVIGEYKVQVLIESEEQSENESTGSN